MSVTEIEKLAFDLAEAERASLAEKLLMSLRPVGDDDDDGVFEALRRRSELRERPEIAISVEDLDRFVAERYD